MTTLKDICDAYAKEAEAMKIHDKEAKANVEFATGDTWTFPTRVVGAPPTLQFLDDVLVELAKARKKFPYSGAVAVALMEEVGELSKALLDESPERIYTEAVQVAAMAMRCALEGDPSLDAYRQQHQGVDALPARGKRP